MSRQPRAEAAAQAMHVKVSPSERERIEAARLAARQNVSDFARDAMLDRADEILDDDPYHESIRVP